MKRTAARYYVHDNYFIHAERQVPICSKNYFMNANICKHIHAVFMSEPDLESRLPQVSAEEKGNAVLDALTLRGDVGKTARAFPQDPTRGQSKLQNSM